MRCFTGGLNEKLLAAAGVRLCVPTPEYRRMAYGEQPTFNENKTVSVIYNGEIFDHADCAMKSRPVAIISPHLATRGSPDIGKEYAEDMFVDSTASLAGAVR